MKSERCLVVESDSAWAGKLRRSLQSLHFEVDCVGDSETALRSLERQKYSLMTLDISLDNDKNWKWGKEFLATLRERELLPPPIIVVSGTSDVRDPIDCLNDFRDWIYHFSWKAGWDHGRFLSAVRLALKGGSTRESTDNPARVSIRDDLAEARARFNGDCPFEQAVFVMMKFPDPKVMDPWKVKCLDDVYGAIRDEVDRHGLTACRADKKVYVGDKQLWDNVRVYMEGCKYGIAVLEDHTGDELNPNVALEYGYMRGLRRNVMLLQEHSFKHMRADLIGTLAKEFTITRSHRVNKESVVNAVASWLVDAGVAAIRNR